MNGDVGIQGHHTSFLYTFLSGNPKPLPKCATLILVLSHRKYCLHEEGASRVLIHSITNAQEAERRRSSNARAPLEMKLYLAVCRRHGNEISGQYPQVPWKNTTLVEPVAASSYDLTK